MVFQAETKTIREADIEEALIVTQSRHGNSRDDILRGVFNRAKTPISADPQVNLRFALTKRTNRSGPKKNADQARIALRWKKGSMFPKIKGHSEGTNADLRGPTPPVTLYDQIQLRQVILSHAKAAHAAQA